MKTAKEWSAGFPLNRDISTEYVITSQNIQTIQEDAWKAAVEACAMEYSGLDFSKIKFPPEVRR